MKTSERVDARDDSREASPIRVTIRFIYIENELAGESEKNNEKIRERACTHIYIRIIIIISQA